MASTRGPGRPSAVVVTRDQVVAGAVAHLDRDGFAAFSIRRLARDLGVTPATIEHHVGDRQQVLLAAADHVLDEVAIPDVDDWRDWVRLLATSFRATMRRHPRAALLVLDLAGGTPRGIELSARLLDVLHRGGLEGSRLLGVHSALLSYVTGFCSRETPWTLAGTAPHEAVRLGALPGDEVRDSLVSALPAVEAYRARPPGSDDVPGDIFRTGIDTLIGGASTPLAPSPQPDWQRVDAVLDANEHARPGRPLAAQEDGR